MSIKAKRLYADLIDSLYVYVIPFVVFSFLTEGRPRVAPTAIFFIEYILLSLFRDCIWHKRSVGKHIMGLRIVSVGTNEPPRLTALIKRNLPSCFMPQIELILICVIGKRVGDFLSDTTIVTV